jgi:hypothetical protein
MASKPRAMPIMGTKRAIKKERDGITSPEVVNSFRKTKPVSVVVLRIPWNAAKSPAILARNTSRNSTKILMLVK